MSISSRFDIQIQFNYRLFRFFAQKGTSNVSNWQSREALFSEN